MKPSNLLYPLFSLFILVAFSACKDIESGLTPDEVAAVEILTIEIETNFDLSARKDWELFVGDIHYDVEINENRLMGTIAKGKGYRAKENGGVTAFFVPTSYKRAGSNLPVIIEDQRTVEKFMSCDPLRVSYGGATEVIRGLRFHHLNTLVTFEIENLPDDARVFIKQEDKQIIQPLQDIKNKNAFKAIIFPNQREIGLIIETANKTYSEPIYPRYSTRTNIAVGFGNSTIISFKAQLNEADELVIEKPKSEYMVRDWPISQ